MTATTTDQIPAGTQATLVGVVAPSAGDARTRLETHMSSGAPAISAETDHPSIVTQSSPVGSAPSASTTDQPALGTHARRVGVEAPSPATGQPHVATQGRTAGAGISSTTTDRTHSDTHGPPVGVVDGSQPTGPNRIAEPKETAVQLAAFATGVQS